VRSLSCTSAEDLQEIVSGLWPICWFHQIVPHLADTLAKVVDQWTAHCLGMRHYGVRHDEVYTAPILPEVDYPEGFHGTAITVDGPFVAKLVEDRLAGRI
jgi:hypothetical protein